MISTSRISERMSNFTRRSLTHALLRLRLEGRLQAHER
jgi:hypothetical protein